LLKTRQLFLTAEPERHHCNRETGLASSNELCHGDLQTFRGGLHPRFPVITSYHHVLKTEDTTVFHLYAHS